MPLVLIFLVITSGPVRARYLKTQLLLIEIIPSHIQSDNTHQHDPSPLTGHLTRLVDHLMALRGGRDQDTIRTDTPRIILHEPYRIRTSARINSHDSLRGGHIHLLLVKIHPDNLTAVRSQQLRRHQTDQSQTDHHDRLAQLRIQQADSLQANRANHREGRLLIRYIIRHLSHQILRHANKLRMVPVRGHPIAYLELRDTFPYSYHTSDIAISQRQRLP